MQGKSEAYALALQLLRLSLAVHQEEIQMKSEALVYMAVVAYNSDNYKDYELIGFPLETLETIK